jgi:hypothetical protein
MRGRACIAFVTVAALLPGGARAQERSYGSTVVAPSASAGPGETRLGADQARRLPGTADDALKAVEDLPGVARAAFGSQQLVVWGAATAETRLLVDGVELPALYHAGGLRSTINGALLRSLALTPGGFGAPFGRALGGLVRVDTRELPAAGVHGTVAADVLDAAALLTAAVGGRLRLAAAARYSWLDRLLVALAAPGVQSYFPMPRWDDYQLEATLALDPGESLGLIFLASDDHLRRTLPAADPRSARADSHDSASYRVLVPYRRDATEVTPWLGFDRTIEATTFDGVPTRLAREAWRFGVRASHRARLGRIVTLGVGLDLAGSHSRIVRVGSLTLPPREGDLYVFGQAPGEDLHTDHFTALQLDAAPWVQAELRWGPLVLTPGLRVDANFVQGSQLVPAVAAPPVGFQRIDWSLDPRLAIRVRAHRRVVVSGAVGLYHQPPDPADLSPVFGRPQLTPARALQATAAVEVRLTEALVAELSGWYARLDGLATRSPIASPAVGAALVQDGSGLRYGGQLMLRQQLWRGLFGWIGYTLGRSQRRDHPGEPLRLFDFDQPHVLVAAASWSWRAWSFGARLRWASGMPRTPVIGSYYDARDDRFDPLFGAHNSARLPDFVQLDVRLDRRFAWRRAALELYLEVQNVTWQRNAEEIVYDERFRQSSYLTGLPTLAVLGAKVSF